MMEGQSLDFAASDLARFLVRAPVSLLACCITIPEDSVRNQSRFASHQVTYFAFEHLEHFFNAADGLPQCEHLYSATVLELMIGRKGLDLFVFPSFVNPLSS